MEGWVGCGERVGGGDTGEEKYLINLLNTFHVQIL